MIKKILLFLVLSVYFTEIFSQNTFFDIWNKTAYEAAHISFMLYDLQNQKTILEKNAKKGMLTASTMKLFTTSTALEKLGADFRFKTLLYKQGTIDKNTHTLNGNLIIKGFGDPTFASKYFYNEQQKFNFVDSIYKILLSNQISTINGKILIDASAFSDQVYAPSTAWDDMANYYACGTHAISILDNTFEIFFKSPSLPNQKTKIIRINPYIPNLTLDNRVLSSNINSDRAYVYGKAFDKKLIIRGTIPKNRINFKIKAAIPNPALYFAYLVDSLLNTKNIKTQHNIAVSFEQQHQLSNLGCLYSPQLQDIIYYTNKKSINQYAEQLAANLALNEEKKASIEAGTEIITDFWMKKGMPKAGFYMADGSGLSRHNRVSAQQFIFLLNYMRNSANYNQFANSLPVNGKNGTLKNFAKNKIPATAIWAKTGSIRAVRAMAGYIMTKSGKEYAFALFINNYDNSNKEVKADMASFLAKIYYNY